MKILWIPQLSSVRDGVYYLKSDSNYNFLLNIAKSLMFDRMIEIHAYFPTRTHKSDLYDLPRNLKVYRELPITHDVFGTRYDFQFDKMKNIYESVDPDLIWENDPTKVRNWRAVMHSVGKRVPVVTYFHWIDSPLFPKVPQEISYWQRQVDGILSADVVLCNSNYAIEQIEDSLRTTHLFHVDVWEDIVEKMFAINPPFDHSNRMYQSITKFSDPMDPKDVGILYNHRISSHPYYAKALDLYKNFLSRFMNDYGWVPKTYFTNPSRKDLGEFEYPHEILELDELVDYYKFIGSDKVHVAPNCFFESEGMWSISTVDAGVLGNAVILPNRFGYAEIAYESYSGYYTTLEEAYEKFSRAILDPLFRFRLYREFYESSKMYSLDVIGHDLHDILTGCLG